MDEFGRLQTILKGALAVSCVEFLEERGGFLAG